MWRYFVLVFLALSLTVSACTPQTPAPPTPADWPTQGWRTSTPEEQGFDSARLAEALQAIREEKTDIHSLLIVRNDAVILDAYFYPYDGGTVHSLASVTKSVMTMLIAVASDQGKLRLDDRMISFFPDREIAHNGFFKKLITVRHLTGMTSGLDCIAANDEQTLTEMGSAPDWVQFTLDLKVTHLPGTHFEYCSPGMHVLSAILQQATGMTTAEYARIHLFEPLGITDVIWEADPQGITDGWAGLYLHPRDIAKIGYLMLHQGQWDGKQIIPSQWVKEATKLQSKTGRGDNYGYGWWVPPPTQFIEFAAEGRGGQYIRVLPELNLIVVTTGGGFEWNEIVQHLVPAMVDMAEPLPANPAGLDRLNATLGTILEPPRPQAVPPLPETAAAISGRTYAFEFSPLDLKTIRWEFDGSAEAGLMVTFYNQPDLDLYVGMDGVYRIYPVGEHNLPLGMRCAWIDSDTLLFEYDSTANGEGYTLELTFDGDRVTVRAKERTHEAVLTVGGHISTPDSPGPATAPPNIMPRLDPSPTPSGSTLPLTCQVTDLNVYINEADGFCFAYPLRFTLGGEPSDKPDVRGPGYGSEAEPVQATFGVDVTPVETDKSLREQAETFLESFSVVDPATFTWTQVPVGGEAGWMVEPVPAMLSYRLVFIEHNGFLYRLSYWPVDLDETKADLDELTQTTLGSFAFIESVR